MKPYGRSYRATMAMRNLYPDSSLYVMLNPVRVFVQVGLVWQEQPAHAPDGAGWGVVKLSGDRDYQVASRSMRRTGPSRCPATCISV